MRVLMFGWEFPPHIAGGLGTACYGIVKGLAYNGVETLFVMPSASGDEDQSAARIINASDVAVASVSSSVDEFLDKVIRTGERPMEQRKFMYSGYRLVVRASSLMNATGDPLVEECREYLSTSLDKKLTTNSIAEAMNISRRTLERRFFLGAGHTLRTEIQMMRMTLAKQLLEETDYRLEDIAFRCGFYDVSHMRQTFARFGARLSAKKQHLKP